jgi:isoleucyl-tRNA synthetase
MNRFRELGRIDRPELEREVLEWWDHHGIFKKSVEQREGAPIYSFYEGPPTANGRPGIHHVMSRTIKDTFCRYKTMKGFHVERKAGWDTHGLPVEIEVERELGLEGRHQVLEYGIDRFNAACRASVGRYKEQWDELTRRMGYWVDLEHPYITFKSQYIESVWWLLKQIYEKGLLYKGYKIQWYSPGSGTVLSSHEVSLGYREVQDPSVYVRFRSVEDPDVSFLAWTTTPWTLISNVALAVGPDVRYVQVRCTTEGGGTERLILAQDRLTVLGEEWEIEREWTGTELVGREYVPLFDYFAGDEGSQRGWRVVDADYVSTEDGTGIVHTAPAFGAEDFETASRHDLPLVNPIGADGRFSSRAALVAGLWFKDADKPIVRDLRDRGLLYRHETCLHNYPHDWRKGTPLMSYPVDSWFIRTTAIKDRLVELNRTINWQPAGIGDGRFGEWLDNNVDWALSRRRFWGTPLPIWQSDTEGSEYIEVIGSIEELRSKCGDQLPADDDALDLHRPFVDQLTWAAPDGGTMRRVEDLIDVWFDSGAMPFAQWHYPFENRENFERTFPGDFIAEGVDQTRGWFYTLHAIAALVQDSVAYKNVVVNGLVLDENGEKMAKSRGNTADPFDVISRHGADVTRWYFMSNSPPWENVKFTEKGLHETARKFFGTLENTYNFFATYANIDRFDATAEAVRDEDRPELDRWILSRLNSTILELDEALGSYHPTRATRSVERLVEELSNWYVRRSRRRFWKNEDAATDKLSAYQTLLVCLRDIALLMSPVAPFFSEWLYQAITEPIGAGHPESVHLAHLPDADRSRIDAGLELKMGYARTISSIVLSLRNSSRLNVRQPLERILVVASDAEMQQAVEAIADVVLEEVNVKKIEFVSSSSSVVKRTARPNFKALGRRLGKRMKEVQEIILGWTADEIETFLVDGSAEVSAAGEAIVLETGDVEILSEGIEGWLVGQENGMTVALDTTLTDELRREGLARESVNRIQNLRKQAGFDVTDRITVTFSASQTLSQAIMEHAEWIRNETLAVELLPTSHPVGEIVMAFEIEEEEVTIGVGRSGSAETQDASAHSIKPS